MKKLVKKYAKVPTNLEPGKTAIYMINTLILPSYEQIVDKINELVEEVNKLEKK